MDPRLITSSDPLVSVILPVHNGSEVVEDTILSVLGQTYRNLELLVVDDGSTDGTSDILRSAYRDDSRVHLLSQPRQGVASARNHGLEKATGSMVAFVDADDLWKSDKISKQVARLQNGSPELALVYTWYANIDKDGVVIPPLRPKPLYRGNVVIPLLLQNFIGNASTPLMRASAVRRVGGYSVELFERSGGQGFEDWHLYLKLAESYEFDVIDEFLTGYRQVAGTMSRNLRPFLANFEEARRETWLGHPEYPRAVHLWSELYLLAWMANRAQVEGMPMTVLSLTLRAIRSILRRDPFLPFRPASRLFVSYVRELRNPQKGSVPGPFLTTELVGDTESWRKALDLRTAFLDELVS